MTTTTTAPATFTITRRSRNLGIGSTSQPVQRRNPATGASWLEIESVGSPDVTGSLAAVMAEYDRVRRVNAGHDYRVSFFVGGVKVDRQDFLRAAELLRTESSASERRDGAGRYMSDAETVTAA
jgi:hypothetical protein